MSQSVGAETAVVHVLDSQFLRPLKVLRYSLAEHGTLQDCPVVVISDDADVVADPFVRGIADAIEFVDEGAATRLFSGIRADKIAPKLATSFAPKYTFLKLLMFKERGFQRHIYIDADMLCLQPFDGALMSAPFDAKAVREFGPSVFPTQKDKRPESFPDNALRYVEEHGVPMATDIAGINSGLVVLEREALSDQIFEAALNAGRMGAFPSEQALTTEILRQQSLSHLRLPLWYNARRRMFASLGEDFFETVRDQIVLLHYTPGKPWKMSPAEVRTWDRLWIDCEQRSAAWVKKIRSGRNS